ncbi:MAG: T9SS type A sorting domain-containing protein, partial [Bacteroidota bacterium]
VAVISEGGACNTYYSLDGGITVQSDSIFDGVGTGPFKVTILDENSLISRRGVVLCLMDSTVNIESGDSDPPVFTNCPTDFVSLVDASCNFSVPITDPLIDDNCGDFTASMEVIFPSGTVQNFVVLPGQTFNYVGFGTGTMSVTYTAIDDSDNSSTCAFEVSVVDGEIPTWANQFVSVDGTCGVDDPVNLLLSVQSQLTGDDNCDSSPGVFPTFNDIVNNICGGSQEFVYEFELIDDSGNVNPEFGYVTVSLVDNSNPIFSGIPADITVNCNDPFPDFPTVTASDNCAGDLTANIVFTELIEDGTCDLNANAEIVTHTWTVNDGCGNEISVDWIVTVFNDEAVELGDDINACSGETITLTASGLAGDYLWTTGETTSSITVTMDGTYGVTVTGLSGCCSFDDVIVTFNDLPTASATGGTLDCSGNPVTLMGSSSIPGSSYAWTGPGGYTSTEQNPEVTQIGTYTLLVTSNGCTDMADAEVDADTDVPDIMTMGDVIDCLNPVATISGSSTTPGVSYLWEGPNNYTSDQPTNQVTEAGEYFLTITAQNGCVVEGIAVVEQDDDIPTIQVDDETIDCNNTSVTLNANSSDPDASYEWSGPNGFSSTEASPEVSAAGDYTCTITSVNGCDATDTGTVTADNEDPDLMASGATINCTNPTVMISASSNTSGVSYSWTGPNGYSSSDQNPSVDVEGTYTITVSAPNGCTSTEDVMVALDMTTPDLMAQGNNIDCDGEPVMISASSNTSNVTFTWTGPDGFTSNEQNPTVGTGGMYTIVITAPNGCTNTTSVNVSADASVPVASLNIGNVDCENNNVVIGVNADDPSYTYSWSQNGTVIGTTQNITVSNGAMYSVIVSSSTGCTVTFEYTLEENIQDLQTNIQTTEATANQGGTATIELLNTMLGATIIWDNGQTGTMATDLDAGDHTVMVTNAFGCSFTYAFTIEMNTSVRQLSDIVNFEIFPTIANDCVNIKASFSKSKPIHIRISSLDGKLLNDLYLGKTDVINECIDVHSYADGVYFISLQSENEIRTEKIIKH